MSGFYNFNFPSFLKENRIKGSILFEIDRFSKFKKTYEWRKSKESFIVKKASWKVLSIIEQSETGLLDLSIFIRCEDIEEFA